MGQGSADNSKTIPHHGGRDACATGPATDVPTRMDASSRLRNLLAADGTRGPFAVFFMPVRALMFWRRGGTTPRRSGFLIRPAPRGAGGSSLKRAPSQFARIHDTGGRVASPAAVLIGTYLLAVAMLLVDGCAAPVKQPSEDVVNGKTAIGGAKTLIGGAVSDLENAKEALK